MVAYLIYDEVNELMRIVGRSKSKTLLCRQEEARTLCNNKEGWSFKCVRKPAQKIDLSQFEDALI